jgi:uncharacterized protein (DUF1810 family)
MIDPFNIERFVVAQGPLYDRVISELQTGPKRSHWMWFIFPHRAPRARASVGRMHHPGEQC